MSDLEHEVRRAQGGDRGAVERLLELQAGPLFRLSCRLLGDRGEAEEAVQEALVRIFRNLGQLQSPARFGSWCASVAANLCRDRLRVRKPPALPEEALLGLRGGEEPPDCYSVQEIRGDVRRALATLSEPFRLVVLLRDVDGMTCDEVAAVLQIPSGTVKSRLHEARRRLRMLLTPEGELTAHEM